MDQGLGSAKGQGFSSTRQWLLQLCGRLSSPSSAKFRNRQAEIPRRAGLPHVAECLLAVFRISIDRKDEGGVYLILGRRLFLADFVYLHCMELSHEVAQYSAGADIKWCHGWAKLIRAWTSHST
jgi:hypothetical protein